MAVGSNNIAMGNVVRKFCVIIIPRGKNMRTNFAIIVVVALAMQLCARAIAQDIEKTQVILHEAWDKLSNIRSMLRTYEKGSNDLEKLNASLASIAVDIERAKNRAAKIEEEVLQKVAQGFTNLQPCKKITWQVAPNQKPFLQKPPNDITITTDPLQTRITKSGNPPNHPVSPSPSYQVGPSFELLPGDRALLRFAIPTTPMRGGTPVPYFGVRDAKGKDVFLIHIGDPNHDGKEHEIRIQCTSSDAFAFFDGSLQHEAVTIRELQPPLFMFFFMNDNSELVIHKVQLSRDPSLPNRQ